MCFFHFRWGVNFNPSRFVSSEITYHFGRHQIQDYHLLIFIFYHCWYLDLHIMPSPSTICWFWKICRRTFWTDVSNKTVYLHSPQECLVWVACLWSKMPMFQRVGMREGGLPLPLAFQYLILVIWRACDLNLAVISSLALKLQVLKVGMSILQPLYEVKLKASKFKVLAFWSQWRYHGQI